MYFSLHKINWSKDDYCNLLILQSYIKIKKSGFSSK